MNTALERILAFLIGWILIPVSLYAARAEPLNYLIWLVPLFGVGIVLLSRGPNGPLMRLPGTVFLLLAAAVFIASRLVWIYSVPTMPFSDFAGYEFLANLIAQGKPIQQELGRGYLLTPWGYPVALGIWFALAGSSLVSAKLLNVLAGVISVILLYRFLGRFGERTSRLATLLFVLWPAQIIFSSVLASEHLSLMFLLAALIFLARLIYDNPSPSWQDAVPAGIFLALCFVIRPVLVIALIAGMLFLWISAQPIKGKVVKSGLLLLAFLSGYGIFLAAVRVIYHVTPVAHGSFALLTGTNINSDGGWNQEDADRFFSYPTLEEANQFATREAINRITSDPLRFVRLMGRKILRTWGDDTHAFYWSTNRMEKSRLSPAVKSFLPLFSTMAQYFYLFLLVFAIIGCISLATSRNPAPEYGLILTILFGAILLHSILEAQPRYHYPLTPFLMLLASTGILREARGQEALEVPASGVLS